MLDNNKTTMENFDERFLKAELILARIGTTPAEEGFVEYTGKTHSGFFWFMTVITWGIWWFMFSSIGVELRNDRACEWVDSIIADDKVNSHREQVDALLKKARS